MKIEIETGTIQTDVITLRDEENNQITAKCVLEPDTDRGLVIQMFSSGEDISHTFTFSNEREELDALEVLISHLKSMHEQLRSRAK